MKGNAIKKRAKEDDRGLLSAHQLETFGVELKCPICLSLYKAASSLPCNHSFCKSCIMQSMKGSSSCPICKIPIMRREVRPAPQLDRLVEIYKSMENIAGVSLFASQYVENLPDEDKPKKWKGKMSTMESDREIDETSIEQLGKRRKVMSTVTNQVKPVQNVSSSKKRVQGPRFSSKGDDFNAKDRQKQGLNSKRTCRENGETSLDKKDQKKILSCDGVENGFKVNDVKLTSTLGQLNVEKTGGLSNVVDGNDDPLALDEFGRPKLVPFFWLREEDNSQDVDGSSSQVQTTQPSQAQQSNQLTFSDLKDPDDDISGEPEVTGVNTFDMDSATFGWTQRLCSPELTCSPLRENIGEEALEPNSDISHGNKCTKVLGLEKMIEDARFTKVTTVLLGKSSISKRKDTKKKISVEKRRSSENIGEKALEPNAGISHGNQCTEVLGLEKMSENASFTKATTGLLGKSSISKRKDSNNKFSVENRRLPGNIGEKPLEPNSDTSHGNRCTEVLELEKMSENVSFTKATTVLPGKSSISKRKDSEKKYSIKKRRLFDRRSRPLCNLIPTKTEREKICTNGRSFLSSVTRSSKTKRRENKTETSRNSEPFHPSTLDELLKPAMLEDSSCAFCHRSGDSELSGPMMTYNKDGIPLGNKEEVSTKHIYVHKLCAEWAPDVYFIDDTAKNLEAELVRGRKMKCSSCGMKGAALGCCLKRCRKSYHYPCARLIKCNWNQEDFIILCPEHASGSFPKRSRKIVMPTKGGSKRATKNAKPFPNSNSDTLLPKWLSCPATKWVLCGSALSLAEKGQLTAFASLSGSTISQSWNSNVTHIISGTDEGSAARRTYKYLMAIAEGKWILKADWIAASIAAGRPVEEEPYEITLDSHGALNGPKRGRSLAASKAPKIFKGKEFYLMGEFPTNYKADLQALIIAAGGMLLQRKPLVSQTGSCEETLVMYCGDYFPQGNDVDVLTILEKRRTEAKSLAALVGAKSVPHTWALDCVAYCKLQPLH